MGRPVTAIAYAACGLTLAGCAAYAIRAIPGYETLRKQIAYLRRVARYHLLRRRYARRMRGPLPARDQGIWYDRRRWLEVQDAWEAPAAPAEKSRT